LIILISIKIKENKRTEGNKWVEVLRYKTH
jgi:hypothetical protein